MPKTNLAVPRIFVVSEDAEIAMDEIVAALPDHRAGGLNTEGAGTRIEVRDLGDQISGGRAKFILDPVIGPSCHPKLVQDRTQAFAQSKRAGCCQKRIWLKPHKNLRLRVCQIVRFVVDYEERTPPTGVDPACNKARLQCGPQTFQTRKSGKKLRVPSVSNNGIL
jgi:hypothetical protein